MNFKVFALAGATITATLAMTAAPLKVEMRDGSVVEIDSNGLEMKFTSSTLIASWDGGTKEIPVSEISSFYFQAVPSSVGVAADSADQSVEVFSIDGQFIGRFASIAEAESNVSGGTYMVKSQSGTQKILLR